MFPKINALKVTYNQESTVEWQNLESSQQLQVPWILDGSSEKDFEVRKTLAWSSCHKLKKIWNSTL